MLPRQGMEKARHRINDAGPSCFHPTYSIPLLCYAGWTERTESNLKISFTTVVANLNLNNGYGVAGYNVSSALQRLGHEVPFQDDSAKVEVAFNQPQYDVWTPSDKYRIQYTPWESTDLPEGWLEGFEKADEVWTPSPLIARWFEEAGVPGPVKVYEHGIEKDWFKASRRRGDRRGPLQFLHHGEPAMRKGGQMALDAFREVFGDSKDVHLTFKSYGNSSVRAREWNKAWREWHIVGAPDEVYSNVSVVREDIPSNVIPYFYNRFDVMVYPGYGEGFGLIPLQGMSNGMPVICTSAWAPYKNFLDPELSLGSTLIESPWPEVHPGKMFEPSFADLCKAYKSAYDNFEHHAMTAASIAPVVTEHYDWDRLTKEAFEPIVQKFS